MWKTVIASLISVFLVIALAACELPYRNDSHTETTATSVTGETAAILGEITRQTQDSSQTTVQSTLLPDVLPPVDDGFPNDPEDGTTKRY